MVDSLLGREDDAGLVWYVPRAEILARVRTVGGIAELAKVDRKTVSRRGIAPNSVYAVEFVRDRRQAINRPLVGREDEIILPRRFLAVLDAVRRIHAAKAGGEGQRKRLIDPELTKQVKVNEADWAGTGQESTIKKEMLARKLFNDWRWQGRREGQRSLLDGKEREITAAERERFKRFGYYYRTIGKVSVQQLCSMLEWSQSWFYKWRRGLPRRLRDALRTEMDPAWETRQKPGKSEPDRHESEDDDDGRSLTNLTDCPGCKYGTLDRKDAHSMKCADCGREYPLEQVRDMRSTR